MATYVSLLNFTEQGLRTIKDTVRRAEAAKKAGAAVGVDMREIVWTQGAYDLVIISEAADETALNAFMLNLLKLGNVRAQTLRGFTAAEMQTILDKVA